MKRFFEIFRAGNYPQGNITEEQVQQIAENYDPSFLEAPVTLDHGWGGPAYGWIQELKAEGGRLLASFKEVSDSLKMMTAAKQYKRHSVEIYNDLEGKGPYLKALTMLGALTPAVKGMEPIEFSSFSEKFPDDESAVIEFDEPVKPEEQLLSEFVQAKLAELDISREAFAQQAGAPEALVVDILEGHFDEAAGEELTTKFQAIFDHLSDENKTVDVLAELKDLVDTSAYQEDPDDEPVTFTQQEVDEQISSFQQQIDALQSQLDSQQQQAQQFRDENEQIKFEARKSQFTSFLEKHIKEEPKFPPKLKDKAIALFEHLDGVTGGEDQPDPLQLLKDIIEGLPELDFDEGAPKTKTPPTNFNDSHELAAAATKYMEEQRKLGNHVSAADAVTHVKKQGKTDEQT